MEVLVIPEWAAFQHYKDRNPPWIKFYRTLWRDRRFFRLTPSQKLLYIGLLTMAAQTGNETPNDPQWLATELSIPINPIDIKALLTSSMVVVTQDASEVLAIRPQPASNLLHSSVSVSVSDPSLRNKNLDRLSPGMQQLKDQYEEAVEEEHHGKIRSTQNTREGQSQLVSPANGSRSRQRMG